MSKICRLCMAFTDCIPLALINSHSELDILPPGEIYEELLCLKLEENPGYLSICMTCNLKLYYFADFKRKATETNNKLTNILICDDTTNENEILEKENDAKNENIEENIDYNDIIVEEYLEDESYELMEEFGPPTEEKQDCEEIDNEKINKTPEKDNDDKNDLKPDDVFKIKMLKRKCSTCGKCFQTEESYRAHMNTHLGLPAYPCGICDKGFKTKIEIICHMKKHLNQRDFRCEKCPKAFINKASLNIHMRIHLDLRPYVCEICGIRFRIYSHLSNHKDAHNSECLYNCPFCQKKFKTRPSLKGHAIARHSRFISGYNCTLCNLEYPDRQQLKDHIKTHIKSRKEFLSEAGVII